MESKTLIKLAKAAAVAVLFTGSGVAVAAPYTGYADPIPSGEVAVFGGGKFLDSNDWSPAENDYAFGGELYYQPKSWVVGLTGEYLYSRGNGNINVIGFNDAGYLVGEDISVAASTQEYKLGVKKIWIGPRDTQLHLEGGVLYGGAKITELGTSASDHSVGGWISAGVMYPILNHWALGPKIGYSYYHTNIDDYGANAGGVQIGLFAAYQW